MAAIPADDQVVSISHMAFYSLLRARGICSAWRQHIDRNGILQARLFRRRGPWCDIVVPTPQHPLHNLTPCSWSCIMLNPAFERRLWESSYVAGPNPNPGWNYTTLLRRELLCQNTCISQPMLVMPAVSDKSDRDQWVLQANVFEQRGTTRATNNDFPFWDMYATSPPVDELYIELHGGHLPGAAYRRCRTDSTGPAYLMRERNLRCPGTRNAGSGVLNSERGNGCGADIIGAFGA